MSYQNALWFSLVKGFVKRLRSQVLEEPLGPVLVALFGGCGEHVGLRGPRDLHPHLPQLPQHAKAPRDASVSYFPPRRDWRPAAQVDSALLQQLSLLPAAERAVISDDPNAAIV